MAFSGNDMSEIMVFVMANISHGQSASVLRLAFVGAKEKKGATEPSKQKPQAVSSAELASSMNLLLSIADWANLFCRKLVLHFMKAPTSNTRLLDILLRNALDSPPQRVTSYFKACTCVRSCSFSQFLDVLVLSTRQGICADSLLQHSGFCQG